MKPFYRAFSSLEPSQRRVFIGLLLLRVLLNGLDILGLLLIGLLVTSLVSDGSGPGELNLFAEDFLAALDYSIFGLVMITFLAFVLKTIFALLVTTWTVRYLARLETDKSKTVARYMFSGDLGRVEAFSEGEIIWGLHASMNQAFTVLLTMAASLTAESSLVLFVFVLLVILDPVIAVMALAYFAILVVIFQIGISGKTKKIGTEIADSSARINDQVRQLLGGLREIRIARKTGAFVEQFGTQRSRWAEASAKRQLMLSLPRYFVETALMLGALVLIVAQSQMGNLEAGLGSIAMFLAGGLKIMASLLPMQNSISGLRILLPQAERAIELVEAALRECQNSPQQYKAGPDRVVRRNAIGAKLYGVSLSYSGNSELALDSVSVTFPAGSLSAIVGKSGAGKSTFVDTLLGLRKPQAGVVTIDGLDPGTFISKYPGMVAYVPQSPQVFDGTVLQNIAFGVSTERVSESKVRECLKRVGLDDWVLGMPNGIHSTFGELNEALSGGQRQRLGLARALYENPKLLVVDEPTSGLDPLSAGQINNLFKSLIPSVTVVIVAHQITTVKLANQILFLHQGRVAGLGSYEDLRRGNSLFQKLFD